LSGHSSPPEPLIRISGLSKSFPTAGGCLPVLRDLNLEVAAGEFIAVQGPSGSGKSTLLHILGCLDRQSAGEYRFAGRDTARLPDSALSGIRLREIGFIFQKFFLLSQFSVLENVGLPFLYLPCERARSLERVREVLRQVGLPGRVGHRPAELSGGEMQRVAIARALVTGPKLILADEPTGNLDSATGDRILDLFERIHRDGATIVMVTHDARVAARAARTLVLEEGRLAG
jgi:ABC-type lipoprotein export system ATPase subunit